MVELLIPMLGIVIGCPTAVFLGVLLFPSTRGALADRLRGHAVAEHDKLLAETVSTGEQLAQLRAEVYALRSEVAGISHRLTSGSAPPSERPALNRSI